VAIHGARNCQAAPCDRLRSKMPPLLAPEMFAKFAKFAIFNS
jgi:hypothetical protein